MQWRPGGLKQRYACSVKKPPDPAGAGVSYVDIVYFYQIYQVLLVLLMLLSVKLMNPLSHNED